MVGVKLYNFTRVSSYLWLSHIERCIPRYRLFTIYDSWQE